MLVKYFEKCLEMDKLKDAPESVPTGVITKEVTYEFTFPSLCFFTGGKQGNINAPWFTSMPKAQGIKTSLGISLEKPLEKPAAEPDSQEKSTK